MLHRVILALVLGVVLSSPASAVTFRLEFPNGNDTLTTPPASDLTVDLVVDLTEEFGGQTFVAASIVFDMGLTPTLCGNTPGPQSVGGTTWTPFTAGCGAGNPGDGGIGGIHPPGTVRNIEQDGGFTPGTSGTVILGTVTFDALAPGTYTIVPYFMLSPVGTPAEGWNDASFVFHSTGILEEAFVTVIPEPTSGMLVSIGMLGLAFLRRKSHGSAKSRATDARGRG